MAAELILPPETEADIAEAYAWYESRSSALRKPNGGPPVQEYAQ